MGKVKTHKGLKKRIKVTGNKKVRRKRAFAGHLMSGKSGKRKRCLRQDKGMSSTMMRRTLAALGM